MFKPRGFYDPNTEIIRGGGLLFDSFAREQPNDLCRRTQASLFLSFEGLLFRNLNQVPGLRLKGVTGVGHVGLSYQMGTKLDNE